MSPLSFRRERMPSPPPWSCSPAPPPRPPIQPRRWRGRNRRLHPAQFARITVESGLTSSDVRSHHSGPAGISFGSGRTKRAQSLRRSRDQGLSDASFRSRESEPKLHLGAPRRSPGVLWVGTGGDSTATIAERDAFTHFRHNPGDTTTLPNNIVLCLFEDSGGDLWVGTRGGLSALIRPPVVSSTIGEREGSILSPNVNAIRCITEDPATGLLWLGTSDGLCAFDRRTGHFATFCREPFETAPPGRQLLQLGAEGR